MNHAEQRKTMRAILSGTKCLSPARVFDPLSARIAAAVGHEVGLLAGSQAAHMTLAAPDGLAVLTLTELAELARRIVRASKLSLLVDADHGYGNALNVMRTVQELEHAGVSALSIEDTALPRRFGQPDETNELISSEEMAGKLRAAAAARQDPSLIIAGRTSALKKEGTEHVVMRVKSYAAAGIDAIFLIAPETIEQIKAIYSSAKLPIILGSKVPSGSTREELAACGVRIVLPGHEVVTAAVKLMYEIYTHQLKGGVPEELRSRLASAQEMAASVNNETYQKWQQEYLC